MGLKFRYQMQQVGDTAPDCALTGDPAVDQVTLRTAGISAGRIVSKYNSATATRGAVVGLYDGNSTTQLPYGTLINGPGNYAESIGPSGSGKVPVTRSKPVFELTNDPIDPPCFDAAPTTPYTIGCPLYAGTGAKAGMWTADKATNAVALGICDQVPSTSNPSLWVTQLF